MRLKAVALVASVFAFSILGASASQAQSINRSLTVEQVILLSNGLKALDGFKLDGPVRMVIAINIAATRPIVTGYTSVREAMIVQYAHGGAKIPDAEIGRFNADDRKTLQQSLELDFLHIKRSDLKLEENQIPPSVLALLLPILDD